MVSCLPSRNPQQNSTMGALAASQIRCVVATVATVASDCAKEAAGTGPAAGIEACAWAALRCGCWNMLEQVPAIETCVILYYIMVLHDLLSSSPWYPFLLPAFPNDGECLELVAPRSS